MTQIHKVTVLIIDHDELGPKGIKEEMEAVIYPNRCISPEVKNIVTKFVDWSDDHPLNKRDTAEEAYRKLFES